MKPPKKPSIRIRRNAKDGELKLLEYLLKIRKLRASYELADGDAKDTPFVELLNLLRIANGGKALSALQFSELSETSKRNVDKYVVKGLDCFKEVPRCTPANKSAIRYSLDLIYSPIIIGFALCCAPDFNRIPHKERNVIILKYADFIDSIYFRHALQTNSQAQELMKFFEEENSIQDILASVYWNNPQKLEDFSKFVTCDKCENKIIPLVDSTAKVHKLEPAIIENGKPKNYKRLKEHLNGFKIQYCHCSKCDRHMVRLIESKSTEIVNLEVVNKNRRDAIQTYKGIKFLNRERGNAPQVLPPKFLSLCRHCGFLVEPKLNHFSESETKTKDGQILAHRTCPKCHRRITRYEETKD